MLHKLDLKYITMSARVVPNHKIITYILALCMHAEGILAK